MTLFWKHGENHRASCLMLAKAEFAFLALALNPEIWRHPFSSLRLSILVCKTDYNLPGEPWREETRPHGQLSVRVCPAMLVMQYRVRRGDHQEPPRPWKPSCSQTDQQWWGPGGLEQDQGPMARPLRGDGPHSPGDKEINAACGGRLLGAHDSFSFPPVSWGQTHFPLHVAGSKPGGKKRKHAWS